jgi:3',5'-cyclic AMP phosphodiesterase CpdA
MSAGVAPIKHRLIAALLVAGALWSSAPAHAELKVYAAGDIAECDGPPAESAAARTAALIPDGAPVLVLGDTVYDRADTATLGRCYAPTWGRFLASTYAVPGNHDYVHGTAHDFLAYFGARVPRRTWFRAPLGDSWWVIGLDSNLVGTQLGRQQTWLEAELKAIAGDGRCLIALWHHAFISTGLHSGDGQVMRPAWQALDAAGADLLLAGHEHFYESFDPRDAAGHASANGIREFVVGTGGAKQHDWSLGGDHRDYAHVYGVLELELGTDHYRYDFRSVDGEVRDAGGARCRRAAPGSG